MICEDRYQQLLDDYEYWESKRKDIVVVKEEVINYPMTDNSSEPPAPYMFRGIYRLLGHELYLAVAMNTRGEVQTKAFREKIEDNLIAYVKMKEFQKIAEEESKRVPCSSP